jgi:hypothetical protein
MQNTIPRQDNTREDILQASEEYVGNQIRRINTGTTLRIGFLNINGLPPSTDDPKNKLLYNSITNNQIGILGMTELNKCWHLLPDKDKWKERSRGWWETSHSNLSYNRNDNTLSTVYQPGGTAIISIENTSHRIIKSGQDPSGLGRWTWTRYRGKHNVSLRVICAYRPCQPSSAGPNTAYNQQQRYFNRIEDSRCPREALLEDLGRSINQWRQDGDQIILTGDFNEDVTSPRIQRWCQDHQLTNSIGSICDINHQPTFHKGTTSIDGIFISQTISPLQGGYLPFGSFPSDHRCLWLDISTDNAFGYNPPSSKKFEARRLKSNNPTVRNKWLRTYENFIRDNNLHTQQYELEASLSVPMTHRQIELYEHIRRKRLQGIRLADQKCRKLNMGGVPFSAKYKALTDKIELWKAVTKKKTLQI